MSEHLQPYEPESFEGAPPPTSTLNPFRLAWRHAWLVALGVVVGGVLGALYYARATPIYQSNALLLVVKKTPDALSKLRLPNSSVLTY